MASPAWLARRERWREAWVAAHGAEPTCVACGAPWTLRHGDLHHRSYARLGRERHDDLTPMCRACHVVLHRVLESTPAWRRMDRAQAGDVIIARLRRDTRRQGGEDA
jgi:predicted HNH restriction endonuclease